MSFVLLILGRRDRAGQGSILSFMLCPFGEERSIISRHLSVLPFLGMAPNRLKCICHWSVVPRASFGPVQVHRVYSSLADVWLNVDARNLDSELNLM